MRHDARETQTNRKKRIGGGVWNKYPPKNGVAADATALPSANRRAGYVGWSSNQNAPFTPTAATAALSSPTRPVMVRMPTFTRARISPRPFRRRFKVQKNYEPVLEGLVGAQSVEIRRQ